MIISGFIGLGYGPFMKAATYQMDEGIKQGGMEAMPNCCIGINQTGKSSHKNPTTVTFIAHGILTTLYSHIR